MLRHAAYLSGGPTNCQYAPGRGSMVTVPSEYRPVGRHSGPFRVATAVMDRAQALTPAVPGRAWRPVRMGPERGARQGRGLLTPSGEREIYFRIENPATGWSSARIVVSQRISPRRYASMATRVRPLQDRVIVKRLDEQEQKTAGGIIIPDTAKEKPQEGKVV